VISYATGYHDISVACLAKDLIDFVQDWRKLRRRESACHPSGLPFSDAPFFPHRNRRRTAARNNIKRLVETAADRRKEPPQARGLTPCNPRVAPSKKRE
jgi:hypothetical protein